MYRWIEHTGEMELEIDRESEEGVFLDALTKSFGAGRALSRTAARKRIAGAELRPIGAVKG